MTGGNKLSEVPSQTSHHKHKHNKNTEFSWSHTKLDSLMTMAEEAPIRYQGWDLLQEAHRFSAHRFIAMCYGNMCY